MDQCTAFDKSLPIWRFHSTWKLAEMNTNQKPVFLQMGSAKLPAFFFHVGGAQFDDHLDSCQEKGQRGHVLLMLETFFSKRVCG